MLDIEFVVFIYCFLFNPAKNNHVIIIFTGSITLSSDHASEFIPLHLF